MDTVRLTVAQAAQRAGLSTKTIRRWIRSGRLTTCRSGLAHVIDPADLDHAMAAVGQSMDSPPAPSLANGLSMSIVQDLLDRLERQAQRIGQIEAELVQARAQLAIAAPSAPPKHVQWWRFWQHAPG